MKMERSQPITIGIKRQFNEMTDSESMSTSSNSLNSTPITPFASLLPPLNKKPKLMESSHISAPVQKQIVPPQWSTNIAPNPQLLGISPTNLHNPCMANNAVNVPPIANNNCYYIPFQSNLNNATFPLQIASAQMSQNENKLSLDAVIATLSSLNSLNSTQINALKTLILSTNEANEAQNDIVQPVHNQFHHQNITMPVTRSMPTEFDHARQTKTGTITPITPGIAPMAHSPPKIAMVSAADNNHCVMNRNETSANNALSNVNLCTKDVKRASCHQCKTKKDVMILFYCTKTRPCSNDSFKRKRCRKKYCESCMAKYYSYNDVSQLRSIKDIDGWCWECPACVGMCTCRACKRKKANAAKPTKKNKNAAITDNKTAAKVVVPPPPARAPYAQCNQHRPQCNIINTQQIKTDIRPPTHNGFVATLPNAAFIPRGGGQNNNEKIDNKGLIRQILANPNLTMLFEQ